MPSATLNLRVSPRRIISRREAAEYCGVPVKRLIADTGVKPVIMPHGEEMFDILDLDVCIEGLKAAQPTNHDDIVERLE